MSSVVDQVVSSFAALLKDRGVPVRVQDNTPRLADLERRIPKRLPESFASFLSRYSFPPFDVLGVSIFGWDSELNEFMQEAAGPKNSLSELLIPAGYVQIGRPDTGNFDAICFDLNRHSQNREYRIVQVDHEDILCNWKVRVSGERSPSFLHFMQSALSSANPQVHYYQR